MRRHDDRRSLLGRRLGRHGRLHAPPLLASRQALSTAAAEQAAGYKLKTFEPKRAAEAAAAAVAKEAAAAEAEAAAAAATVHKKTYEYIGIHKICCGRRIRVKE